MSAQDRLKAITAVVTRVLAETCPHPFGVVCSCVPVKALAREIATAGGISDPNTPEGGRR